MAAAGPGTGRLAVLSCEFDGLAALEHGHGPTVAEAARSEVSGRLVTAVRQGDLVARVGSQTFVLLCPGILAPEDAAGIADRVAASFDQPLHPGADLAAQLRI